MPLELITIQEIKKILGDYGLSLNKEKYTKNNMGLTPLGSLATGINKLIIEKQQKHIVDIEV